MASASSVRSNVLDPHLPLLASQAALEIDDILQKKQTSVDAIQRLVNILNNTFENECHKPASRCFVDNSAATIFSQALKYRSPRTLADLAEQAWEVTKELESVKNEGAGDNAPELTTMKTFCLNLARSAATYRQKFEHSRPLPSYRR